MMELPMKGVVIVLLLSSHSFNAKSVQKRASAPSRIAPVVDDINKEARPYTRSGTEGIPQYGENTRSKNGERPDYIDDDADYYLNTIQNKINQNFRSEIERTPNNEDYEEEEKRGQTGSMMKSDRAIIKHQIIIEQMEGAGDSTEDDHYLDEIQEQVDHYSRSKNGERPDYRDE
ncbi:hypothetical protein Aduo_006585 [Ancylostoma duodenale]